MTDVAIVSTARTALAKSVRGSFNNTHPIKILSLFSKVWHILLQSLL